MARALLRVRLLWVFHWVRNLPPFRRLFLVRPVKGTASLEKAAGYVRPLRYVVQLLTLAHDQVALEEGWSVSTCVHSTCVQCDRTPIRVLQVDVLRAVWRRPVHVRLTVQREFPCDPFLGRLRPLRPLPPRSHRSRCPCRMVLPPLLNLIFIPSPPPPFPLCLPVPDPCLHDAVSIPSLVSSGPCNSARSFIRLRSFD